MRHAPDKALVLGLGRFGGGREAIRFLVRRGYSVRVADRCTADALAESVAALGDLERVEWCLGRDDAGVLDGVDVIVVNPAVPVHHPTLDAARRRGVATTQEVNLFLDHYPGRVVLVTGTNGKSTTATLLAGALRRACHPTLLGGNLGHSLLADEHSWSAEQTAVVEISSFQLERLDPRRQRVHGAVFTRVTRDHLDRHQTLHAYHAAKARAAAAAGDFVVHAADDPVAAAFATAATRLRYAAGPTTHVDACVDREGYVAVRCGADPGRVVHRDALCLLGEFQAENVLAASLAAARLGAPRAASGVAFAGTRPLQHRLQLVTERHGIRVFDNGVSTEVLSTASALDAVAGPVRWVGGGKSKDGDFAAVAAAVAPRVASAHLFGAAGRPLQRELARHSGGRLSTTRHDRLEDALDAAWQAARPRDALLFSPAFASFDQYPNFRARAEAFRLWLRARFEADRHESGGRPNSLPGESGAVFVQPGPRR